MKIQPDFITETDELELGECIKKALAKIPERKGQHRNRIFRAGWDYLNPEKWLGEIPPWVFQRSELFDPNPPRYDSWTLNEYVKGQIIFPHIDSPAFGDVAILSLLADVTMRFTSPAGEVKDFALPRRSLAVMSGELRKTWTHETLPLEADKRFSVVYRKRLT